MTNHTLRVALDWTPNTIHSGLFLARAKGLYQAQGLDVELIAPDARYAKTPAKRLEAGEVDLAICPSESCIAYQESGKMQLQAIYAVLQKDASAIASTSLSSIRELAGKRYGSYNARYEDAIVRAMVVKDGGDGAAVEIEQSEGKLSMFDALRASRIDATWIFLPWEGVEAKLDGVQTKNFTLHDSGIPYGYSPVIARNANASPPKEILEAFVAATKQGYEVALQDPQQAVEALEAHCEPQRSKEFLTMSQEDINRYYADGSRLGSMDEEKWSTWLSWLKSEDLLAQADKLREDAIFTNEFFA